MPHSTVTPGAAELAQRCPVAPRHSAPLCRAERLLTIRLARPDLAHACAFFVDFGLRVLRQSEDYALLRGASDPTACVLIERGPAAYLGFSFELGSEADLQRLARAHGMPVVRADCERGGYRVLLRDPNGLQVEALWGYQQIQPLPQEAKPDAPTLRINSTVRLALDRPCSINKLGHTVIGAQRIAESIGWYQQNFGLIVSDFQMLANDPLPVVAFMRCDRGDQPTDHHSLAIASAVDIGHLHSAFEVSDVDSVAAGGEFLRTRGYHHTWGIGRHILGSQIFDYWRDPSGDMFEHYTDGDLFDSHMPTGYHLFHGEALHQWGPAVSPDMAGKQLSWQRLHTLFSRLRSDDDLTGKRLLRLIRAAG